MCNIGFCDQFVGSYAVFKPYRNSDHAPAMLVIPTISKPVPKPFKFFNIIARCNGFKEVVKAGWEIPISGFHMFKVVKRLKLLKKPLRKLLIDKGNVHANVTRMRTELDKAQMALDVDPHNVDARNSQSVAAIAFNDAVLVQEQFLKQKAKIDWLNEGDSNSAYFFKVVKGRMARSRIDVITTPTGTIVDGAEVPKVFVDHYEQFLGQSGDTGVFAHDGLFSSRIPEDQAGDMIRLVSDQEIKEALFSMGNEKAPGPDGFTAAFFKEAWDIIASDFIKGVKEFFQNGRLLKEVNHTIIALIPKVRAPAKVNDYRPISCCNVLFKCISKIIANRIKDSLKLIVSPNQSAFVPGRSIADNILLTQELMHNYHLDRGEPRCAFKIDIQKAYDTVDWKFLENLLGGFGFHQRMIGWIMECVSTTSFSISINGSLHGFFKGRRGLRQGDPLSPYLFTLVMEVLTLMLNRRVRSSMEFGYHRYCADLHLINLCFADDLFLFMHGDIQSVRVVKEVLEEFTIASGLTPSIPKSTAYFCNIVNQVKIAILNILPFEEGCLPVKYLGVPLVSSRLLTRDCRELVERVRARVEDWKSKSLSGAGRLQLIQSVIGSMHIYWASVFLLPSSILYDIEQVMRGFLWCQGRMGRGKAKVAWEVVCRPKDEGGLGLRRLDDFNKALMVSHVWKLLTTKESLWVKWIHAYKLKGRNFWDYPVGWNMSWGWRKILQLRPLIRDHIWSSIGNGESTSLWFDKWCTRSPLAADISSRNRYRAGLSHTSLVKDVVLQGAWNWPDYLMIRYPYLNTIQVPILRAEMDDKLEWYNEDGEISPFTVHNVWSTIRYRSPKVDWYSIVWYRHCIPRHAFHIWLVVHGKLKTQDRLAGWEVSGNMPSVCSLCGLEPDSHNHLFFECGFSAAVWVIVRKQAGLNSTRPILQDILDYLRPIAKRRTSQSVIAKLVVAAAMYFVWQERNQRLFRGVKCSAVKVSETILTTVRLKLLSCRFRRTTGGIYSVQMWNLPNSCFV